ncbi:recombinase family protein [Stagnihabitans tardus]|uniref:Recombinase family protein n=1 Tax=Stagnihabitans tardus TaxID=2699202 RepID=A0AAE4YGE0_9RHOB|nr:recombinase family protein [Stagnihabitans tardus]NBZ89639.1 recombinase family protein [Stagnihabitans tardus]
MTKIQRVAIYARFSTDKQRDASIEDQVDSCRDYVAREGWEIVEVYSDRAISGASMFRPGIERLQRDARAGRFDIVLSEAMDRVSRSLSDIARFHEILQFLSIPLWTLKEGRVDRMMIGMKGTMNAEVLQDIALKTVRGQKGRARKGKSAGGNSFGYDVLPGVEVQGVMEHGDRAINLQEAAVVRRIFEEYARGHSPRKIAERLNLERIPGPRGGTWGASTLHGNRERGTGILNNALYAGELVWNKLHYSKDPETGKRVSRVNPDEIVERIPVPHLRIIDDALWQAVRRRQGELVSKETDVPIWDRRRPRTLFSGLMECGCCSSGFSKVSKDSFGCSAARNKGAAICTNMRLIKQKDLEAAVLEALSKHLMDPEAVALFCEEYTVERNKLAAKVTEGRGALEKELVQVQRNHGKLVDAILAGVPAEQVKDKMVELDARRKELEHQFSRMEQPDTVRLHPGMAAHYREKVAELIRGLADTDQMETSWETLRSLVDKIVLTPQDEGAGLSVDLHGALASLLRLALGLPVGNGVVKKQRAPRVAGLLGSNRIQPDVADLQGFDFVDKIVLVAGASNRRQLPELMCAV